MAGQLPRFLGLWLDRIAVGAIVGGEPAFGEAARLGAYERDIRQQVDADLHGAVVAIDVEGGNLGYR